MAFGGTMKNKLKKVFAAGLGLAMIFSQSGCKAGTPRQTSASNAPDAVQTDIPDLCKTVASKDGLGEDAIVGTCYGDDEISDAKLMQIVTKHFNAVTLENELKPETMFGNSNAAPASDSIHKEELNGEQIDVPTLSYARADKMLDQIASWNSKNPDHKIRVRGHVLVWHSQTPEWFFHEGYDKSKDYVSKEEMNKRLEWYIKTVLTYYTGDQSKYKDLFYGFDVVNEAISDASATYRTDSEQGGDNLTDDTHSSKSSWWKVYGSNEYIINAFKFANKYAPASLELYYNDYNECDAKKRGGIITLINDVKAAEGTRITGFGMQGHYGVNSPSVTQFEEAAKEYAKHVDKVMLTELDLKPSATFDGSEAKLADELNREGDYFARLYECAKNLKKGGVNFCGVTLWGVIDSNSWLQSANNVGGASDGKMKVFPLLFDEKYQAKLTYWAFVDPSKIEPVDALKRPTMEITQGSVNIDGEIDEAWNKVQAVKLEIVVQSVAVTCDAKLLWDKEYLYVLMDVKDKDLNDKSSDEWQQDSIEVFIDEDHKKPEAYAPDDKQYRVNYKNKLSFNGEKCKAENMKSAAKITDGGYLVEACFKWTDITPEAGKTVIGLELQVNDATSAGSRTGTLSWADDTGTGYMNPSVLGNAKLV
uniref:Beta-xylanase n=1 Tax=uncultured bacterium Contig1552 TaxID=1393454 RepID=W0FJN9_9BACT|nr:xylanase [uncultured bacterium Contig1552]